LVLTALDIIKPFFYKRFFDQLVTISPSEPEPLIQTLLLIILIGVVNNVAWRSFLFINNFFQPRVMSDLLNTCFEYTQNHSYRFFGDSFLGSLVTKVRRYQKSFEDIADQLYLDAGRTVLIIISIVGALFLVHTNIALMVLGWSACFLILTVWFNRFKQKYDLNRATADTKTTAQLADTMANNINLKLFTSYKRELGLFKTLTQNLYVARKKSWDMGNIAEIFQVFMVIGLEAGVMYYAIQLWHGGLLTVGDFALIQAYINRIVEKIMTIGKSIRVSYEAMADANEMTEILTTPHEIVDVSNASKLRVTDGAISFDNVLFAYQKQNIFKNFTFDVLPHEKIALVGESGGGKTTIVKMLLRFFDIDGGRILIDGQDISQVTQDSLRANVSLVPQEPILFHRSLYDNIAYAKPNATKKEVHEAARLAHAHEFISRFSEGYDTFVGERGVKLSGGERQRVAIARAILKNAPILVLDEATSSLDSESEMLIQDALKNLMKGKTTIVIAHRLSTIMQMDRIVVIKKGKIVEQGKHEELIKARQGIYQKLWEIQAGGFDK